MCRLSTTHQDSLTLLLPASSPSVSIFLAWVSPHPSLFTAFLFNAHVSKLCFVTSLCNNAHGIVDVRLQVPHEKVILGKFVPQKGALTFQKERCRQIRTLFLRLWTGSSHFAPRVLQLSNPTPSLIFQGFQLLLSSWLPSLHLSPPPIQVGAFIYLSFRLLWILVVTLRILVESCRVLRCILGTLVVMRALEHVSSGDTACGHSSSTACGVFVPQPGMEPAFPELQGGF